MKLDHHPTAFGSMFGTRCEGSAILTEGVLRGVEEKGLRAVAFVSRSGLRWGSRCPVDSYCGGTAGSL